MLWTRVVTGVILAPLFLLLVYLGAPYFNLLVGVIAAVMAWEFTRMDGEEGAKRRFLIAAACVVAVIAMSFGNATVAWAVVLLATLAVIVADQVAGRNGFNLVQGAVPYVAAPAVALIFVLSKAGWESMFWLLAVVWLTDIGAYASGRIIGGPKIAPAISPNKTWSGTVGGLIIGTAAGLGLLYSVGVPPTIGFIGLSLVLSLLTVAGDLLESALKRRFHVKDSGGLIPGHGGVMDRFDGLWAAAPAAAILCVVYDGGVKTW